MTTLTPLSATSGGSKKKRVEVEEENNKAMDRSGVKLLLSNCRNTAIVLSV
jgi:hypothetical protein